MATQTGEKVDAERWEDIDGQTEAAQVSPPEYGKGYTMREVGPVATSAAFGGDIHGVMMRLPSSGRVALDGLAPQVYGRKIYPPAFDVPPANHIG